MSVSNDAEIPSPTAEDAPSTPALTGRARLRSIGLPTEHGGWGFTFEPILLGLLVASSSTSWEIAAAAVGIFLARRPVKIFSTDLVRRRWLPRSRIALAFSVVYVGLALAGAVGAFVTTRGPFWIPVLVAVPLALFALRADAHSKNRGLAPELAGSVAMGATVSAITIGSGWGFVPAFGLWLVLAARDVGSVVFVRGQVRRLKGRPAGEAAIYAVQAGALAVVAVAAAYGAVPWPAVVAVGVVATVPVVSLRRPPVEAPVIGWTQMGVGLAVVLITAAGVLLGW